MNIQIITSSYPAFPDDPSGTAGLFVRAFALELRDRNHRVVIQPVARKEQYTPDAGLIIEPLPWRGGDRELASLNLWSPANWPVIFDFIRRARTQAVQVHGRYDIDRTLCMWTVPAGLLGYRVKKMTGKPYDVWALGSDIWKIRKIPVLGRYLLKQILGSADRVFADGIGLCREVDALSGRPCEFLPSSRLLPSGETSNERPCSELITLLFVGRYHRNKGPDLLLQAMLLLPQGLRTKVRLRMFGLGPLKQELLDFVARHHLDQQVTIGDGIDAVSLVEELSRSAYLVIPSRIESIPVIFSDALQMGTPVVATPVGDLGELITAHDCGIVAQDFSPRALTLAIETACTRRADSHWSRQALNLSREFQIGNAAARWLQDTAVGKFSGTA